MNKKNHINVSKVSKAGGVRRGFTLIEILVVIGIMAILASVVLEAVNPARQFELARDSQRVSNVNAILNAVDQNIAEHGGLFTCGSSTIPIPTGMADDIADKSYAPIEGFDVASCVVPAYISALPFDPSHPDSHYTDVSNYNTNYSIVADANGRITVSALGEITPVIQVTR